MLKVIESVLSLPLPICNIIYQYAKPRITRQADDSYIQYALYSNKYYIDEEMLKCSGISSKNKHGDYSDMYLMNRLGLKHSNDGVMDVAIMSIYNIDLLLLVTNKLLIYEMLPNCRYKLLNTIDPYIFTDEIPYETYLSQLSSWIEPEPRPINNIHIYKEDFNHMHVYEDLLILSRHAVHVHCYKLDASYNLSLIRKFDICGYIATIYMYVISYCENTFYIYDLFGKLLHSVTVNGENLYSASSFIISDDAIFTFHGYLTWYMIDLNASVISIQKIDKLVSNVELVFCNSHSDVDNDDTDANDADDSL